MLKHGRPKPKTYTVAERRLQRIYQAERAIFDGRNAEKNRERMARLIAEDKAEAAAKAEKAEN